MAAVVSVPLFASAARADDGGRPDAGPVVGTAAGDLTLIGSNNLGGAGLNGPVAVVGHTAIVASGINPGGGVHTGFYNPYPCPATTVKLVNLEKPDRPEVVGTIPVAAGVSALDVSAIHVRTPTFTGDLAAVALATCGRGGGVVDRGVAYYDVSDAERPAFLGRYQADSEGFPAGEVCGKEPPADLGAACSSSQHSVSLLQRPDGKVLSVSTEPFATASGFPSGDMRVVDVTDPRKPAQFGGPCSSTADVCTGAFPNPGPTAPSGFSNNGCRPFSAGHDAQLYGDGSKALLAYLDAGLMNVNLADPAHPSLAGAINPYPTTGPDARRTEGNGGYAAIAGPHDNLALLSDEDWIAPTTTLRVDTPSSSAQGLAAGSFFGCEAMFTLFDPHDSAQIFRHAGSQVPAGAGASAEIVYVGRSCPVDTDFGTKVADPYLKDAAGKTVDAKGKIVVVDRATTPNQGGTVPNPTPPPKVLPDPNNQINNPGSGCSIAAKAKQAQDKGAIGVIIDAVQPGGNAFSPDGLPSGLTIPVVALDRPAATQLRNTLCPSVVPAHSGNCTAGARVTGALVDKPGGTAADPGGWGGLRVLDLAAGRQVGQYKTPRSLMFPPPDLGVYSAGHAVSSGSRAYVAWNSDGVRVLDLANPAKPLEVGSFVPRDVADPTGLIPAKSYVVGVATAGRVDGHCLVVATDINAGLYVLADRHCPDAGGDKGEVGRA